MKDGNEGQEWARTEAGIIPEKSMRRWLRSNRMACTAGNARTAVATGCWVGWAGARRRRVDHCVASGPQKRGQARQSGDGEARMPWRSWRRRGPFQSSAKGVSSRPPMRVSGWQSQKLSWPSTLIGAVCQGE